MLGLAYLLQLTGFLFTKVVLLIMVETGRLKFDSESKHSYRNMSREYRHDEDKSFRAYKTHSSNSVCYLCHRLGHIAIYCEDVKCYACGKKRSHLIDTAS